jgi:hypothetical protein
VETVAQAFDPYMFVPPLPDPGGGGGGPQQPALTLSGFMDHVRWLLRKITHEWAELLIPHSRRNIMRDAFVDLDTRDVFTNAKAELAIPANQQALASAGLTGTQLEMKLGKFTDLWARFMANGSKWLHRI